MLQNVSDYVIFWYFFNFVNEFDAKIWIHQNM